MRGVCVCVWGGGGGGADESISNARKRNTLSFRVLSSKYQSDLVKTEFVLENIKAEYDNSILQSSVIESPG